jgi:hypothetical protein
MKTNLALKGLALVVHVREVLGSNLGQYTGYHGRVFFMIFLRLFVQMPSTLSALYFSVFNHPTAERCALNPSCRYMLFLCCI